MAKATDDLSKYGLKEVTVRLKLDKSDPRMPDMVVNSPYDATIFARSLMEDLDREYTMVVNLNNKLKPINYNIISIGDLTTAQVSLTNIFKSSILSNAYGFIFFHNHPSGDATPSDADMEMTKQMIEAGKLMNIPLFDHIIIVGKNRDYLSQSYFSFRENYKELFSTNKAIDLAYIRSFSHGMTKAEKVGEQNRTFHTERGQRMDLKGQRDSVFSATIETKDAWCSYLKNASYFVTYNLLSAMQIVDRYPNGTAVATKEIWESIGYHIKEGEEGLSILSTRNAVESEKIVYELSQMDDQKNFSDSYLWSLQGIHAKDLYQTLAKVYPEIGQEGMSPSMAVQLMVRTEFAKAASKYTTLNSNTILSLEHFVTASVTYSILTRMFKETDRKIFFPVSDQQFSDLKKHRTLEPALRLFYEVVKQVSGRLSDCVKSIRKEYLERSKENEESESSVLRGRASAVGILPETGNLAPEEPSGSVTGTRKSGARQNDDVLSAVPVGLQRSGVSLHGENEGIEERRNAGSADAERAMGHVDAGAPDRSEKLRGSRDGLQTVEPENFVSETDTKAESENPVSKTDTKAESENPVSKSDTKNTDRYEIHKLSGNPYQKYRYLKSVAPLSEELLSNLSLEDWTNNQKDEHKTGVFPVEKAKENSIVPKEWAEVCDAALRDNPLMWFHGRQELVTEFSVALSTGFGNITDIVKKNLGSVEYGSGYRFREPDGKAKDFCSWFTPDGIILAKGRSIRDTSERILVSWEDAAQRIKELLLSGMYLPDSEMDLMRNKYLKDAAEAFAFTTSDFDRLSPAMNDSFLHDLAKCTGTKDIKSYYPDRTNLIMLALKGKEGAGKLADLARYYYDLIAFAFSSDQSPMIKHVLRQFRENILPKFDVIEQSYSAFPRTGFTYDNRPEIYISDEEMENLFRNIPTGNKFSFLEAVENKVDPGKALHGIYNSYQGATFGGRYFYDVSSSNISLRKEHIIGQEDIETSYALNKTGKTVMDMQNHHRFLFSDDIKKEPIFASDWLSGEILKIFSNEDKLGNLIRYSEKILGRETVNEKDFGASANLHVILSREIFSKEMAENTDTFSDLHQELQNLAESASKETQDRIQKAISHLEAFARHDYHPFGNLSEQMAYNPSRLPEIIQKEKENPSKNIGFATEDSPESEQLSFFNLLNQQSIENSVSKSDTKTETENFVSKSDTKIETENPVSKSDTTHILSYPNPEEMPSRNPAVKNVVNEMATRLQGKEMSYMTFFLPENRFYLEIMRGNNNLLSSEEIESGMMQWDVTSFHDNFSDRNRIDAMAIKTAAQEKLLPEDLLYTAMYGLGLLDSSYQVVNHFLGNPDSVGEMENGNKIVFRFAQDRFDQEIYDAFRFNDFHADDGNYRSTLAWVTSFGRIDRMDDRLTEDERKEIEAKSSSLREEFRKKYDQQSPDKKFEFVRRHASQDIQLAMLHDEEEGLGADQVADRYFYFALYKEGDQPKPYRKEPEKLVENVQNIVEKASDTPDRKRPVLSLGPKHRCYQMFNYLFPDLLNKESDTTWLHYKMEGYEDLNVEHLYDNVYSIAHTYVQNGDLMNDPSMEVMVDDLLQVVEALDFRNDGFGVYEDFRDNYGIPLVSREKRDAEDFLLTWLKNIDAQGYVLTPNLAKKEERDFVPDSDTKVETENPVPNSDTKVEGKSDSEETNWSKLNPDAVKQHLEEDGVLHGEVIDEEELQKDSLVTMMETSAVRPNSEQEVTKPDDNFVISDDLIATGTPKVRFQKNVDALRTLFQIDKEKRAATREEKAVLAEYSGWGGLSAAFDEKNESWQKEYSLLKELLPEEEYQSAIGSTLNAHYTGAEIIRGVYQILSQMGFSGGKVLEPSMGTGHFFGLMPDSMAQKSTLTGVELDSISGRIAQLLYPSANITIDGFEKTKAVNTYDLAVGNVPFGKYGVSDPKFNAMNLTIHNYFFVKALDEVRPGGLVCFLTSRYTMDAKDSKVRKYLAERAELVSAVRFPQDAFKETANAEVITDLLVFQKKERPEVLTEYPDWVSLGLTDDNIPVNEYFLDNPDHVFGTFATKSGPFGPDLAVLPQAERTLEEQFSSLSVPHTYYPAIRPSVITDPEHPGAVPADPSLRDFSYGIIDGKLYYRDGEIMYPPAIGTMPENRIRAMIGLASKMHKVIDLQINGAEDQEIKAAQIELNEAYDSFVKSYQRINSTANSRAFSQDSDYFLLCGLEILDTKGKFVSKADIFTKRTISPIKAAVHCETAEDALVESVRDIGHVDLDHMNDLLGWGSNGKDRILKDLSGVIFRDPTYEGNNYYEGWETSDQYLSGNVRIKLEKAEKKASSDPRYTVNVDALKAVQPEPIEAADISIRLGATWIKKSYYEQFMRDLFQLKGWQARSHEILFEPITGKWKITEKNHFGYDNVAVNETYGTNRKNAAYILEDCLNLSATIVYDSDGHGHSWKNEKETQLAQMKQEEVKRAFADWIMKDPVRRKDLTDTYNRIFNSTRERIFDGSYLKNHLPGINTSIQLRPHQLSAVARTLLSGNTLLAHAVGAGKTFEMIASAMEAKRLGLCHKSMFVVPNHLVEQWGKDFLLLYPGANILVADKKTFSKDNRKKFTARIAAGDYDAVIIGHSQFQMIPLSDEMQEDYFNREINSAVEAISRAKNEEFGSQRGFTVQQLQQFIKSMQHRLEKIMDKGTKDDVIRFEKLGIDRLYVDEAHNYKNLYFFSKLSRVPGVNSGSDTNKTLDLSMKVNYINKLTDYKGVIFATGTPVSNSVSECYTMMKYLEPQVLEENGFNNFDAWATTFGEVTTAMELAPEGNGFRMKQRFAKFYNVPELMKIFREVSDIKVSEDLQLDVPDAERESIVAKPSQDQKSMMEGLTKRAEAIHKHLVDPTEDNMLKITTDGRKIGLDPRLIDPDAFDDPESKLNLAVEKIYQIWEETKKNKSTQMVFCDFSVPGKGGFNVYDDMKEKLISKGIPAEEIAFIHNANTDAKKEQLFSKVRAGNVRILFGSTAKMGEGTNCQERLIALHHLDAPWKPSELDQRDGRIIRQGNSNPKVHIFTYVTEGTFDAYLYQTLLRKQKFIGQIMTNKTSARQMDDVDDRAMNYAEIMAVTAGSPELREKLTLDNELASLRELRTTWANNRMRLEDKVRETYPETIRNLKARIENYKTDKLVVEQNPLPAEDDVDEDGKKKFVGMEVNGKQYATVPDAADAIHAWANAYNPLTPQSIGHYRGFEVLLRYSSLNDDFEVTLKNSGTYKENLGKSGYAFFTRLDHILDGLSDAEKSCTERLESTETALKDAKVEITKPFPQEEEYQAKEKRLAELNAVLSLNDNSEDGIEEESKEKTDAVQKAEEEDIKKTLTSAPENFLHFAKECDPDIFSSASIASKTSINMDQKRIGFTVQYGTDPTDYNHIFAEIQNDHSVKYWMDDTDGLEKIRENYMKRVLDKTEELYHAADVPIQNLHGESFGPSGHMITLTFLEKGESVKLFGSIDHGSLRLSFENGVLYSDFLKKAAKEIAKSQMEGLGEQDSMISSPVEAVAEPVENINHAYHPKL